MSEWKEKTLGELTALMTKGIAPAYVEEENENTVRVLNQKCNRDFRISYAESRLNDIQKKKVTDERYIQPGDVLINSTGMGTAGRIAQMWNIPCRTTIDGHMILLRPSGEIDPLYFGYSIKMQQPKVESFAEGSTGQTEINRRRLSDEIKILYPVDKWEQHKIAQMLSDFDEKIENNEKINDNLQQQAQAVFQSWFIDNPASSEWPMGSFADFIEKMIAGDWGKDSLSGNNTEMVYCIRGADIPDVKAGNKGKMPTRFILPKNYAAKQLVAGDIVVEISGGSPTQSTGRAAAISDSLLSRYDHGMVCTNFCKALKPKSGCSLFVYHYWQYLYDKGVFFNYENGTTGIKNLDISGFIESESIVIPPNELIYKFDCLCEELMRKIYANGYESEQLSSVRDTLLPRLMSGEFDVSNIEI